MKLLIRFLISGLIITFGLTLSCSNKIGFEVGELTCNYKTQPLGVEPGTVLLGWKIFSEEKEVSQSAYRILVGENPAQLKEGIGNWDSGKVTSEQSINVPYPGSKNQPGKRCFWKVKVWDNRGRESDWSEISWWQNSLLSESDWHAARWIAHEKTDSSQILVPGIHGNGDDLGKKALKRPVTPQFRKTFSIEKEVQSATLTVTGMGHYIAFLNGKKVGKAFLSPGWTDYDKTVLYNTYDVTAMLVPGENVLGALLGNGFYNINRERYRKLVIHYGEPVLIGHLQINYTDRMCDIIVTDESWKTAPSPITYTSIYGGEDYDANLELNGWKLAGYDDTGWENALIAAGPAGKLVPETDYPLLEMEHFDATKISKLDDGSYLYDFGQNASGIVELKVRGVKGEKVMLFPSELIHSDGTANQSASGSPYLFNYTLRGSGLETWKPAFTYYGFRYVQVKGGIPLGEPNPNALPEIEKISLIHTRNSSPENGAFTCSSDLLNRIHELIDWAIKSNYQSVVTDCPHREKLGWLEQTHLMGQGVHFRYDNYHLYRKLIFDMMDAQTAEGLVPDIAPEFVEFLGGFRDSPEWGSAAIILPYLLYKWYGDQQLIEKAWPMMLRYVSYLKSKSENHILDFGLGDWFDLGPKQPGVSQLTPVSLTATAFYFYDVKLMAEMAAVCHKPEQKMLEQWAGEIWEAFNMKFYDAETKVYSTGSQTAMSLPYCMGIVEDANREAVFKNLVDTIVSGNKALTAGDVGFHYLVEALTKGGASDLMYEMIHRDDVPGYGYQLKKGATSLTESWQALENVSNNHLMLGHVMEWFYAGIGGIGQSEKSVAYKDIVVDPQMVGDLKSCSTSFNSPYGLIACRWIRDENKSFEMEVDIPCNTTATIYVPVGDKKKLLLDNKPLEYASLEIFKEDNFNKVPVKVGSGKYHFIVME